MANTEFIGPNGNSESIITHAAIASWAGFVYQGLCALCVAMENLLDEDEATTWYLNIEGYEDFAILDADKHILSFHQCKDYKAKKDWKDEFGKMVDKRAYWYQKNMCEEKTDLWFHTNLDIAYSHGVKCYIYKNGSSNPNASEIFEMVKSLVDEYCKKNIIPVSSEKASNRLIAYVDKVISEIDVEDKRKKDATQQISIEYSVPFKVLDNLIRTAEDSWNLDEKVRLSVFYMEFYLKERIENNPQLKVDRVKRFLNRVHLMTEEEKVRLVEFIFPDINVEKGFRSEKEISEGTRFNFLFKLLTKTAEELNLEKVHWQNEGIFQSPSTMGSDMEPVEYCSKIATNTSLPPELLRDYDWIVGCFDESVDDILGIASTITRITPIDYDDITKTRKTGLLSIKDKNDGKL